MPRRPLLRPGHRLVADGGRLLLEHGQRLVVLEGRAATALLPALLPLLDGSRTAAEIAAALGPGTAPAVDNALRVLASRQLVCEGPGLHGLPRPLRETSELIAAEAGAPPSLVAGRLAGAHVAVLGSSRIAAETAALVAAAGVTATRPRRWRDPDATFVVAAPGRGEAGAPRRLNRRALRAGTAWLPVLPYDGRVAAVGPLILPGETACWACYQLRRAAALEYGGDLAVLDRGAVAARSTAALDRLAAELAALQALRWLGVGDPGLPGTLQVVELSDGVSVARHQVLRVPRCPACSGLADVAAPLPWFELRAEAS